MIQSPVPLLLVGVGRMGGALLSGWLKTGFDAGAIVALDPAPSESCLRLCAGAGVRLNPPADQIKPPAALVIAVKPQTFNSFGEALSAYVAGSTLVLSIMAGKTISDISARLSSAKAIVRAMPNTAAEIGKGISGAVANPFVDPQQHALADRLLSAVGAVEWFSDENLMNAVTAVSGSGPAYVFYLAECLAAAGAEAGLPRDVAARLARRTVEGAGELLARNPDIAPETLRANVTSPGGTTAAALEILMADNGLSAILGKAVVAARDRGEELSG